MFAFLAISNPVSAALNLAVEAGPDPVQPGQELRVAITVTNPGGSPSGTVRLQFTFPTTLSFLSESLLSDDGFCPSTTCDPNEVVEWNLGSLDPGEGMTVDFPVAVLSGGSAPPDGTQITFDVDAFEGASLAATAQHSVTVLSTRVFDLSVDEDRDPVATGTSLDYQIVYGNRSDETTTSTVLRFPIPSGTTFVSASDGGFLSGGVVIWNLGTLVGHEGGRRTVRVNVSGGLGQGAILKPANASVTGDGDFLTHISRATAVTRVESGGRLKIELAVNPDPPRPGDVLQTRIMVSNPSASSFVNNVVLSLRYPVGLNFLSESLVSDSGFCPSTTCDVAEQLFWNLGNLPPGRGLSVNLPPIVASQAGGGLITLPLTLDADNQSRSLARQTVIVRSSRIFDLAVEAEGSPAASDHKLTYTVVYGNRSAETTTGTVLRVPIPAGTSFVSASDGGTFNGRVVWNLGTLVGREGGQRQFTVQVPSSLGEGQQLLIDPATISGQGTFFFHESRARSVVRVEDDTRLDVAVAMDRDPVVHQERVGIRVSVTNRSAIDFANNVVLRLRYPQGLAFVSESLVSDSGSCPSTTCDVREELVWNIGNLPPGGGSVVELPPTISSSAAGGSVITLPIQADATDRSRTLASHPVLVRESRFFDLGVDLDLDPVATSGSAIYSVTYGNRSNENSTGTTLRLPVPEGATFGGASDGGVLSNGAVQWNLGTVSSGETGRRRALFNVPVSTNEGALLRAFDAEINGTGTFFVQESRQRDARRVEDVSLQLTVDGTPEPVLPGATLNIDLQARNTAPSFLFTTVSQLRYPEPLNFISESFVSDGGFCPSTTCDDGELVIWNLGDMSPGAVLDRSLPPVVGSGVPNGSLIRFWAQGFAANFGKTVATRSIAVGNNFDDAGPIVSSIIFTDGFESGNLSVWSRQIP